MGLRDSAAAMTRVVTKEPVSKSEASLRISVDSLLKLPERASYQARSGQATAKVEREGDTIRVWATCDSLEREVELWQELYAAQERRGELYRAHYEEAVEHRRDPLKTALAGAVAGLTAGVLLSRRRRE